ncbi:nuclear transport factor 2 family protein [Legionella nagasakiensis]|uniref:nuclear transport factor 2 family protein n=1 Tax=Legionella nagasakiensis TaxID=535290 RepID=UPI0010551160|nr:nuclear transport factor 2 family protein [Legionella nagasakiensis]
MSNASKISENLQTIKQHFDYEASNDIDKVITTYTEDVVWEAPARHFKVSGKEQVAAHYRALFATLKDVSAEIFTQFATEDYVFDDRLMQFTITASENIWSAQIGDTVKQRLVHLFEMRDGKISKETAYELWEIVKK